MPVLLPTVARFALFSLGYCALAAARLDATLYGHNNDALQTAATATHRRRTTPRSGAPTQRSLETLGPYLPERQWGTVREDYSASGDAWNYFPFEQAQSRAYRWGEDGLSGLCDRRQLICFAIAFWNGRDPILKERLFGLSNGQGNQGEDVKEHYFYLDGTPTHSYMRYLYKYPQTEFPYRALVEENTRRTRLQGSLSRYHRDHPCHLLLDGAQYSVDYEPGESTTNVFGGNANWRGPVWFPLNFLLIKALQKFHFYYGNSLRVECPIGSANERNLWEVARYISHGLIRIFLRGADGRPLFAGRRKFQQDPHWRALTQFHEYFHGDTGEGLSASHQTGWTALVAKLIEQGGAGFC